MDCQLVGQITPLGDFDRIHFADEIGDRDVRRRELFAVAFATRCIQRIGVGVAFSSATSCLPGAEIGSNGFSGISMPSSTGVHSSSSETNERRMRDFAWPRSPSRIRSCPDKQRVLQLWKHGIVVTNDAGEEHCFTLHGASRSGSYAVPPLTGST